MIKLICIAKFDIKINFSVYFVELKSTTLHVV